MSDVGPESKQETEALKKAREIVDHWGRTTTVQVDYLDELIADALTVARDSALEEAAKVCDLIVGERCDYDMPGDESFVRADVAETLATAIRALKGKP